MSIESKMPSNHLNLSCYLLLFSLSQHQGLFQWISSLHQIAKYWSFSFSISPSNDSLGLASFTIDWIDLLAVQGSHKILLQHHSSKASILQCSALFIVQHSHPYMTTGKTIALTRWTFSGKVMSLLFNMLSRLVMSFPGGSDAKTSAYNAGDPGSVPGLWRSPGDTSRDTIYSTK